MTFENELARERARQQRRREAGLQRGLSERLEGHTTPLSVGVGRSPLVTPTGVRDALQRAMDMAGVPTAPPARVGVAPNVSSPSSGVPSVTTIRAAAQDLPSPTFSPRQIDVMERILRNVVPEDQIDALLDSVGLDNNQLADYIAQRPPSPPPPPTPAPRGRSQPRPREGAVNPGPEAEAGDAAGCHPEGVAGCHPEGVAGTTTTTMEARPAGAAVVEGDVVVVAVGVGVGVAAAHPLDERA